MYVEQNKPAISDAKRMQTVQLHCADVISFQPWKSDAHGKLYELTSFHLQRRVPFNSILHPKRMKDWMKRKQQRNKQQVMGTLAG